MKAFLARFGNVLGLLIAWIAIYVAFGVALSEENFLSFRQLELIARQSTIVGLAAVGMTFVIITAGIDLSVGSMVAFVSVVAAYLLKGGADPILAITLGVVAGGLCGLLNGSLITGLKVTPFIITLGTLLAIRGAAKGFADEQKIDAPVQWIRYMLASPATREAHGVPSGIWGVILLAIAAAVILKYTRFGRHVVAVGSNEHAARLCGVPVERVKIAVYSIAGLCAGLAGIALLARLSIGDPTAVIGLELRVIAAVVIGGASLAGGTGSIGGTLAGVMIMETIRSGSVQLGWPNWVQEIVTGAIIVAAVAIDRIRHRRQS